MSKNENLGEIELPKKSGQSFRPVLLAALLILSACTDGSSNNLSNSQTPIVTTPTVTPPPPAPPMQAVGEVQFTIDNSITASQDIAFEGGEVVLDVPGGARFTMSFPRGAFFADTTLVTMQSIVDTQGLPNGLTPIAAVSVTPAGAQFAVQPTLEIDLQTLSRPTGNVVIFLANEDGTGLTYLIPEAGDKTSAVLSDGPYRALVPDFSGIGVAVSDPNGPGISALSATDSEEMNARRALNKIIEVQGRNVIMGLPLPQEPIGEIATIIADWQSNIDQRVAAFNNDSELRDFVVTTKELFRSLETSRSFDLAAEVPLIEETETGAEIVRTLAAQLENWNKRCIAGNANAIARIRERNAFLRILLLSNLLGEETFMSIDQPNFCVSTGT